MKTIGIIGGAGFIGSYVTKIFLEEDFIVKVSATDVGNTAKYDHLQELSHAERLTLVPCNVLDQESLKNFVAGCDIVIHGGTPFKLDFTDPQAELSEPTITGTRNFLHAIQHSSTIKKVVCIASVAAWNSSFPLIPESYPADHIFTEADTPYISEADHPYAQAKFMADQEVRKFLAANLSLPFELNSISPTFVIGSSLSNRPDSTSQGMQYLIKNKLMPNPFLQMLFENNTAFAMVDVRDVAEAVFQAATRNGLHGKNYLLSGESYSINDISLMLNQQPPLNNPTIVYNSALAKKDLGLAFIAARETLAHCI